MVYSIDMDKEPFIISRQAAWAAVPAFYAGLKVNMTWAVFYLRSF